MKEKKKLAWLLLGNSVLIVGIYFLLINLGVWFIAPIYVALAALLAIGFIVYNRGFAAKNATPEQLPNHMTAEQKAAYIAEGKERLDRSRWVLTLLFPTILALAFDLAYLFIFPYLQELIS